MYKYKQLHETKVFKDPVHRYVRVNDQVIWDLIATPEFQRLRRIKQLGTTYLTFHGAEHSRFNHSLGVYEIVRRIVDKIEHYDTWNKDDRLLCLCAALLHDLGHGPFSHSFEHVFDLDHEEFTKAIILGETKVNAVLRQVEDGFPEKVAAVINKTYDNQLVVSLISSQIDADRMDYLLRDAYYTGVSYGQFDMERILRVMRPTENQIVIKSTGMHAVEDYIMSRYQMYWQVYFHPVTRSSDVILTKIFDRANDLYQSGYQFKVEPILLESLFENRVTVEDYLQLDEAVILFYFQRWLYEEDPILRDLCTRFIERNLYKYVEFDKVNHHADYEKLIALFEKANIDPKYYLVIDSSSDLPYDVYRHGTSDARVPIYLQMPGDYLKELSEHSVIVDAITGRKRIDDKLYYPQDLIEQIPDESLKQDIIALLEEQKNRRI
ncbi:MAG TPA: HD domain-containing protein [Pseudogracilibacillus sp.]|nr:HD domain-containing protein [Pseudogracilibacillus sp.]